MKPEPCSMALLVEAKRDGRLGHRELASVDRHLATCASCAELVSDLSRIRALLRAPTPTPAPLSVQRSRLKLLREAALPASPAQIRSRPLIALAVALAAAGALGLALHPRSPESPVVVMASAAASANAPLQTRARTTTSVSPEGEARFTRASSDGTEIVRLSDGAVILSVRHLPAGERFLVKTGDAEVEVRGTLFRVEAASDRIQRVSVVEGKVEVRFHGATFFVTADERWDRPAEAPLLSTKAPAILASSAPERTGELGAAAAKRSPGKTGPAASAKPVASGAEGVGAFEEGMAMMERGDYDTAARHLDAFSGSSPGDDRAEDAAFLVILALQRAGRPVEAAAAARRYLARYPSGYRRAQAKAIAEAP
jgi:ferric-dicitrate binding protein FerR (iron transport regulator)